MSPEVTNAEPVGITPKVKVPAILLTALGAVLVVVGAIIGGDDGGTVRDIGLGLLGAGPLAGVVGAYADLGPVRYR